MSATSASCSQSGDVEAMEWRAKLCSLLCLVSVTVTPGYGAILVSGSYCLAKQKVFQNGQPIQKILMRSKCGCGDLCLTEATCKVFEVKALMDSFICSLFDDVAVESSAVSDDYGFVGRRLPASAWKGSDDLIYWFPKTQHSFPNAVSVCQQNNMELGIYKTLESFYILRNFSSTTTTKQVWVNMLASANGVYNQWADGTLYENTPLQGVINIMANEGTEVAVQRYHFGQAMFNDLGPAGVFDVLCQVIPLDVNY